MRTVYGLVADRLGLAHDGHGRAWATPAAEIRTVQGPRIPVTLGHDPRAIIGEVVHFQRDRGGVWAVAHVNDSVEATTRVRVGDTTVPVATPLYWSAVRVGTPDFRDISIEALGLTPNPARVSPRPVRFLAGTLDYRQVARERWQLRGHEHDLLQRAAAGFLDRRKAGGPLVLEDLDDQLAAIELGPAPMGDLRIRAARQVDVSSAHRTIELVVIPYNTETLVPHPRERRMVTETICRGAFDGVEAQSNRIRVNRDHIIERTIGRAVSFDSRNPTGLLAELKIARTLLGDETIALAEDGCLDASAAFRPLPGGETWETRDRVRMTNCWLGHIALTPDPAYETANITAVRSHELHTTR